MHRYKNEFLCRISIMRSNASLYFGQWKYGLLIKIKYSFSLPILLFVHVSIKPDHFQSNSKLRRRFGIIAKCKTQFYLHINNLGNFGRKFGRKNEIVRDSRFRHRPGKYLCTYSSTAILSSLRNSILI